MKVLIAPDSFKECADSVTISEIVAKYLTEAGFEDLILKPISDGGDGFLNVCSKNFKLIKLTYNIPLPYGEKRINCSVGYNKLDKTIYIESAKVLGLNLIPAGYRHPLHLSSKGMGVLLKNILRDVNKGKIKVEKIKIGIGGTGTNDMGIGMVSELGLELLDKNGCILEPIPFNLKKVRNINWVKLDLPFKVEIITDVTNPLLGKLGASKTFGQQKGLNDKEIKISEDGFGNIVEILKSKKIIAGKKFIPGAGGGLAAGFQIFFKAKIIRSDFFIMKDLKISKYKNVSAVITGEGLFDKQSFMNKSAGIILKKLGNKRTKIFLVCGNIDNQIKNYISTDVFPIEISKYFNDQSDSIKFYKRGIRLACLKIAEQLLT